MSPPHRASSAPRSRRSVRDDAGAAYSHAAPAIQQLFPRADIFMSMVRSKYPPVYRHKRFEFGEARSTDGHIAQRVHIIDADGEAWEALYTLEQQPDGSLKITGCSLLKAGQTVYQAARPHLLSRTRPRADQQPRP